MGHTPEQDRERVESGVGEQRSRGIIGRLWNIGEGLSEASSRKVSKKRLDP